jgi:hypothetical protein
MEKKVTKKHFVKLAAMVKELQNRKVINGTAANVLAIELGSICSTTNPLFDRSRFYAACGVKVV